MEEKIAKYQIEMLEKMDSLAAAFTKKMENKDKDWAVHIQKLWEMNSALLFQSTSMIELLVEKNIITNEEFDAKLVELGKAAEEDGATLVNIKN